VRRAEEYAAFRRRLESEAALEPTDDPQTLVQKKDQLARRIHDARANAKAGDIFTEAAAKPLRRLIRMYDRVSLEKESGLPNVRLRVNTQYAESQPLPTMPPPLLALLPEVPEELQYRLIGRDLALLDLEARIVVDVLRDVRP
jgi:hypothetical protein